MDRAAWWATVYGVAKSQIQLSTHTHTHTHTHTPLSLVPLLIFPQLLSQLQFQLQLLLVSSWALTDDIVQMPRLLMK